MNMFTKENMPCYSFHAYLIGITSASGAGSTSTLKALQELLKEEPQWQFISGGDLMRKKAADAEMDIQTYMQYAKDHPEHKIDLLLDLELVKHTSQEYLVVESRLAHLQCIHGFKVLLTCPYEIRAARRSNDLNQDILLTTMILKERDQCDEERYNRYYPGCLWDPKDYDLVICTSDSHGTDENPSMDVARKIVTEHRRWLNNLPPLHVNVDYLPNPYTRRFRKYFDAHQAS